ncbi:MAG: sigma-54-dependent Fis family transcriptional regulator [Deltaproteobacteria bacterium]|nr:sigma-54-dependent Fis family transcriptional regulator [Deltaproteobacteria bacterium]MBW2142490.1 sigma-54-dependent Fis family transcriptional regulator [Deltaproteobacteria bacterium]
MDLCDNFIIGNSQTIIRIRDIIRRIADMHGRVHGTVMIYGEAGVGKSLVAQIIHSHSKFKENPFIEVSCDSIPISILERELFGHQTGVSTIANNEKLGKLALAQDGTIFLNEVGDISIKIQKKLLKVFTERIYTSVGSNKPISANCRIITSTCHHPEELVKKGHLDQALYYRLNVFPIYIPPLRERKQDLESLFNYFANQFIEKGVKEHAGIISRDLPNFCYEYSWPGNVREFKYAVNKLIISADWEVVKKHFLGQKHSTEMSGDPAKYSIEMSKIISQQNNEVVVKALSIIKTMVEKGIKQSDEIYFREQMATIKEQNPDALRHLTDIFKRTVSGTITNILYNWLLPIITNLPK